jgi:hypothetical protein
MAKKIEVSIVGQKIVGIRNMTSKEIESEGGYGGSEPCIVLILENGTLLYASRDEEGNGPGTLFGKDKQGRSFYVFP